MRWSDLCVIWLLGLRWCGGEQNKRLYPRKNHPTSCSPTMNMHTFLLLGQVKSLPSKIKNEYARDVVFVRKHPLHLCFIFLKRHPCLWYKIFMPFQVKTVNSSYSNLISLALRFSETGLCNKNAKYRYQNSKRLPRLMKKKAFETLKEKTRPFHCENPMICVLLNDIPTT